jgi:hypothetical protein
MAQPDMPRVNRRGSAQLLGRTVGGSALVMMNDPESLRRMRATHINEPA